MRIFLLGLLLVSVATACTKEEYRQKFGATHELHGTKPHDAPRIENGEIVVGVTYSSHCPNGGSNFVANAMDKENGVKVFILARGNASCPGKELSSPQTFTGTVSAALPKGSLEINTQRFIAFPPDGDFELFLLKEKINTFTVNAAAFSNNDLSEVNIADEVVEASEAVDNVAEAVEAETVPELPKTDSTAPEETVPEVKEQVVKPAEQTENATKPPHSTSGNIFSLVSAVLHSMDPFLMEIVKVLQ